ncbi:hypothetical protein V1503_23710 [Bacillus sp. SCS-151]|uniref:hypothetical protein n=1 Tax=Nanhaiella sioensis TaxID=3115293 RepID=UPI00397C5B1C
MRDVFKITATGENGYVNKTFDGDDIYSLSREDINNGTFRFFIAMKTADDSPSQTVSLRLRNQGNLNGGNGDNDTIQTFTITNYWALYSVVQTFDKPAEWIRATIYPAGFKTGDTGSVLVANANLDYISPSDFYIPCNFHSNENSTIEGINYDDTEWFSHPIFKVTAQKPNAYVNTTFALHPYRKYDSGEEYKYEISFDLAVLIADDSPSQIVTIRLRSQGHSNCGNGDNDIIKTFSINNDAFEKNVDPLGGTVRWIPLHVTQTFDKPARWVRATIYPAGHHTERTGSIYINRPMLNPPMLKIY